MGKLDVVMKVLKVGGKQIVKHLPSILTAVGTAGVVGAIILTAKKTPDAKKDLDEAKDEWDAIEDKEKRVKADYIFKLVRIGAKHYWVVIAVATGAIVCFWAANHINLKRLMKATTALGLATKSTKELTEKVKELDGEKHLQKIMDEIDGDRVRENPPVKEQIYDTGLGMHMVYEPISGRYFYSNIERVKKAVIICRDYLQNDGYISLNDWYNELGLGTTEQNLCWTADSKSEVLEFDVTFSSQVTPDGAPVLVIRYSTNPTIENRDW